MNRALRLRLGGGDHRLATAEHAAPPAVRGPQRAAGGPHGVGNDDAAATADAIEDGRVTRGARAGHASMVAHCGARAKHLESFSFTPRTAQRRWSSRAPRFPD